MELKAIRKKKKLTQVELAEKAGISLPLVSMIECGKRSITVKTAKKLEPVLGVKWYKLIEGGENDGTCTHSA